ncbi:hypothetical protein MAFF211471_27740 [Ralstonia solanacearum]|nr:hypothetical protein MAFF211471_27740 [Ralstonia solanacearum]BCN00246.1 hypothetical protein RPSA_27820 [Ralstonia solanacearum]BEU52566.1 hypothetical protein MAFF211520_28580 [Ralstonia pseudosolanacearum]BEU57813.1 hypothetical protein MAFF211521_28660 [Ralstonia pseudosolanacearum]BEU61510.1 hypothetical protein MAFF301524_13100 [Ralstonia pseudosolanacearum]
MANSVPVGQAGAVRWRHLTSVTGTRDMRISRFDSQPAISEPKRSPRLPTTGQNVRAPPGGNGRRIHPVTLLQAFLPNGTANAS